MAADYKDGVRENVTDDGQGGEHLSPSAHFADWAEARRGRRLAERIESLDSLDALQDVWRV